MPNLNEYQNFSYFLRKHLKDNILAIENKDIPSEYFKQYYQGVKSAYVEILLLIESLENQE